LKFIRSVYECLGSKGDFGWHDVLALMDRRPELLEINSHVCQKALQEG